MRGQRNVPPRSEIEWIKRLRQLDVTGQPLRRRFTLRGDSLWWFAELYLHKQQVVLNAHRTIAALDALVARERPTEMAVVRGGRIVRSLAPQAARTYGIRYRSASGSRGATLRRIRMDLRARGLMFAARASRARTAGIPSPQSPPGIAAFVHRAFWRSGAPEGSAESYIGPVLEALEDRAARASPVHQRRPVREFSRAALVAPVCQEARSRRGHSHRVICAALQARRFAADLARAPRDARRAVE